MIPLLLHQGRRLGFECKVADAPKATKSMHIALQDLALDGIFVISPRAGTYPLAPKITACGLGEAIATLRCDFSAISTPPPATMSRHSP